MKRFLTLALFSFLSTSLALADTAFQDVEERAHFRFRYPSGRYRSITDTNTILMFNRAWSDTTGRGRTHDYYFSSLNEDGDSVGVWVWVTSTDSIPAGKYFFVETEGTDSLFSAPDYVRLGFDLAPENSVDEDSYVDESIQTEHLDPDSLIDSAKYIKSDVIKNVHISAGLDGAKLTNNSVPSAAVDSLDGDKIQVGTLPLSRVEISANKMSASAANADTLYSEVGQFARIEPPQNPGDFAGHWDHYSTHTFKDTLLAEENVTFEDSVFVEGKTFTYDDMYFGTGSTHDAFFSGRITVDEDATFSEDMTIDEALKVGTGGSDDSLHVDGGLRVEHAWTVTIPAFTTTGRYECLGAEPYMLILATWKETSTTYLTGLGAKCFVSDSIDVTASSSVVGSRTVSLFGYSYE